MCSGMIYPMLVPLVIHRVARPRTHRCSRKYCSAILLHFTFVSPTSRSSWCPSWFRIRFRRWSSLFMQESRCHAASIPCVSGHLGFVAMTLIIAPLLHSRIFVADKYEAIFVLLELLMMSRSSSMSFYDRRPLPNTPASDRITQRSDNRFGAVLSSLYYFWSARAAAIGAQQGARRDSYSVILFNTSTTNAIVNDFSSSPDQLLDAMLPHSAYGGTCFTAAIQQARSVMEQHWSTERCSTSPPTCLRHVTLFSGAP